MMGVNEKQTEPWVEPVNLARRVPDDHIPRKLNKALKLSFVRHEVTLLLCSKGHRIGRSRHYHEDDAFALPR